MKCKKFKDSKTLPKIPIKKKKDVGANTIIMEITERETE